jgi:hypothetical protein
MRKLRLLGELEPFLKENSLLPREVFFIRELELFPSWKLFFFPKNFSYSTWNLFETST